jgi:predicted PurR-regulated permease PerM
MERHPTFSAGSRILLTTAAFVVVVAGMRAAASIVVPFLLSAFIAILCAPFLFWLQRKRIPTVIAVLILVLVVMAFGLLLVVFIGTSLSGFSEDLPFYQERIKEETASLRQLLSRIDIDLSENMLQEYFNPGVALQMTANTLSGFFGMLTNAFLILLTVIFILLEASGLPAKTRSALADPETSLSRFSGFIDSLNRYLAIKTVVSLATGFTIWVWLTILGVDYPLLWGLVAFLLNYVPNIGSIIAAIPAMILGFIQFGPLRALLVISGYLAVNFIFGSLIEPRFMGRGLGLSTLVVFLSLVFWGWILGPVGMLLSVPLTMIVKIALESNEDTRWLAVMLGQAPAAKTAKAPKKAD